MKNIVQNISLSRLYLVISGTLLVLLLLIAGLGFRQYFLYRHCDLIVQSSKRLLFEFTVFKEHTSEALLSGTAIDIGQANRELQAFDTDLKLILDDLLIPQELKLTFISQIDLLSLVVQLRGVQESGPGAGEQKRKLGESMRSISARLQQFDTLLDTYTRSLLIGLHRVIVGSLALLLCAMVGLLLLLNKSIAVPLHNLCRQLRQSSGRGMEGKARPCTINQSLAVLSEQVRDNAALHQRLENLEECLVTVDKSITPHADQGVFWETLCQSFLTNPDFFLVWAGRPATEEGSEILGCACHFCSPVQGRETVEHLLRFCHQDEGICRSFRQAMEQVTMATALVQIKSVPETLLAALNLDAVQEVIATASFPLPKYGKMGETVILTFCSIIPGYFGHIECGILSMALRSLITTPEMAIGTDSTPNPGAQLYRFAMIGALADMQVSQLTNIANGSLNYCQALLDLAGERQAGGMEKNLLGKLHGESQKIAALAADMHRLTAHLHETVQKCRPTAVIDELLKMLLTVFTQDRITVQQEYVPPQLPELALDKTILQTVLLSLLWHARSHLIHTSASGKGNRVITIAGRLKRGEQILSLWIAPFASATFAADDEALLDGPWPSLPACRQMLQQTGGDLRQEPDGQGNLLCAIILPLQ